MRPSVGVGVVVRRNNKVLLGRRVGIHGTNTWSFPGGHLEYGESIEDCARRETLEESGLEITNLHIGPYTNSIYSDESRHYVVLIIISDHKKNEPVINEPDKIVDWEWFSWDNLPKPLFLPVKQLVRQGFDPFNETNRLSKEFKSKEK